jgi:hypothetical protein
MNRASLARTLVLGTALSAFATPAAAQDAPAANPESLEKCDDKWLVTLASQLKALDAQGLRCALSTPQTPFKIESIAKGALGKIGAGGAPAQITAKPNQGAFATLEGLKDLPKNNPVIFGLTGADWASIELSFEKIDKDVVLKAVKKAAPAAGDAPAADHNGEVADKDAGDKKKLEECDSNGVFDPGKEDEQHIIDSCKHSICITPSGKLYGVNQLTDHTGPIAVELWAPRANDVTYSLEVSYEKTVLNNGGLKPALKKEESGGIYYFSRVEPKNPQPLINLNSAGKLTIKVTTETSTNPTVTAKTSGACHLGTAPGPKTLVLPVTGRYYFMLGFMPTYGGIFDRKNTLHRGDDGVQRVFQQDTREVDYAATLTAFPYGVDEERMTGPVPGFVLGTSIRNPGKRWYLGLAVSTPINIAFVAGAELAVVDALDEDFVSGQPLEDTNFPTHSTVVPTWFVGVNVEAELFKKAFKGIVGDGK